MRKVVYFDWMFYIDLFVFIKVRARRRVLPPRHQVWGTERQGKAIHQVCNFIHVNIEWTQLWKDPHLLTCKKLIVKTCSMFYKSTIYFLEQSAFSTSRGRRSWRPTWTARRRSPSRPTGAAGRAAKAARRKTRKTGPRTRVSGMTWIPYLVQRSPLTVTPSDMG